MCGIAGYASLNNADKALNTVLALLIELLHRGQESTGIAYINDVDGGIRLHTSRGTAFDMLLNHTDLHTVVNIRFGAIGHTRYSTSGGYLDSSPQPKVINGTKLKIALAFNGTIANYKLLIREFGVTDTSGTLNDADVLAHIIYRLALDHKGDVVEALKEVSKLVIGGYSIAVLTSEPRLVLARDPHGFRPLVYSYRDGEFIFASESAALDVLGFNEWVEVPVGGIVSFDGKSIETVYGVIATPAPCAFEYIYISRPDSVFNDINVHEVRVRLGYELAKIAPVEADVVIPVPDSGRGAAIGYSRGSGIPLDEGLVINRYIGRGFIMPPHMREMIARLKYGFIRNTIRGRRIVLVDDSIVRGTTMAAIAAKLKSLGAREVHIRISSPPFMYPCFMGVDVASRGELIAWRSMNIDEIALMLNADSVAFNTVENVKKVVNLPTICMACFTGLYPFRGFTVDELEKMFSRDG